MRLLAGLAVLALLACPSKESSVGSKQRPQAKAEPPDITAEDYLPDPLPQGVVYLEGRDGPVRVEVEVAATQDSRTRGLMWRKQLAEGRGMLFIFPFEERLGFWMRNTLIPLDMIFLDRELAVVGVVENAEPRSLESRGYDVLSQFVVEVPGGWSRKIGLKEGAKARLEGVEKIVVR